VILGAPAALAQNLPGAQASACISVRYTFTRQLDGVQLAPQSICTERGLEITGPAALDWLVSDDAYQQPRADVFCLALDGCEEPIWVRDLDLCRPAEPFVYLDQPAAPPRLLTDVLIIAQSQGNEIHPLQEAEAVEMVIELQAQTDPIFARWLVRTTNCYAADLNDTDTLARLVNQWLLSIKA
jgi:hypothetical protein